MQGFEPHLARAPFKGISMNPRLYPALGHLQIQTPTVMVHTLTFRFCHSHGGESSDLPCHHLPTFMRWILPDVSGHVQQILCCNPFQISLLANSYEYIRSTVRRTLPPPSLLTELFAELGQHRSRKQIRNFVPRSTGSCSTEPPICPARPFTRCRPELPGRGGPIPTPLSDTIRQP
jgi:hypothetical protein